MRGRKFYNTTNSFLEVFIMVNMQRSWKENSKAFFFIFVLFITSYSFSMNFRSMSQREKPSDRVYLLHNPLIRYNLVPDPGFLHRDSTVFPCIAVDMSEDPVIARCRNYLSERDILSLIHELRSQEQDLQNTFCIDRYNRYVRSRRLSFIAKHVQKDEHMNLLFLIHNAPSLKEASMYLRELAQLIAQSSDLRPTIGGQLVWQYSQSDKKLIAQVQQIIKSRPDYQAECKKYPDVVGHQIIRERGPILDVINKAFLIMNNPEYGRQIAYDF